MFSILMVFVLVWASAYSNTIDQIISKAAENGVSPLKAGEVLVDMDMIYPEDEWKEMISNISTQKGVKGEYYRWTNKHVPYVFRSWVFSASQKKLIIKAMDEWEKYTCITFGPRKRESNYVTIQDNGSGCNSYVGMRHWGSQTVNLARRGCLWHHTIVHEFGHAIGFHHEHQRPDRDGFVNIYLNNVGSKNKHNFNKISWSNTDTRGVTYDYLSVMHYGRTAFSRNGRTTVETKDADYRNVIGRSPGLSFSDIKLANLLYKCDENCGNVDCGPEGFVGKDCKCWCNNHNWNNRLCECGTEGCGDGGDGGGDGGDGDGGEIECEDLNERCVEWAERGECTINPTYMLHNCAKACKICGEDESCLDFNADCSRWNSEGYCKDREHRDYMRRYCRFSCDFCNVTDECHDQHARCEEWATRGECAANTMYMLYKCPRACQICGDNEVCRDFKSECEKWQTEGHCTDNEYEDYMKHHCRKSCSFCS